MDKRFFSYSYGLRASINRFDAEEAWISPPGWMFTDRTTIEFPNRLWPHQILAVVRITDGTEYSIEWIKAAGKRLVPEGKWK